MGARSLVGARWFGVRCRAPEGEPVPYVSNADPMSIDWRLSRWPDGTITGIVDGWRYRRDPDGSEHWSGEAPGFNGRIGLA